jgi:hypothetical protein
VLEKWRGVARPRRQDNEGADPRPDALFCLPSSVWEDMNNTVNPAPLLKVGATRYCLTRCQQPNYNFEGKYISILSILGKMGATRAAFR